MGLKREIFTAIVNIFRKNKRNIFYLIYYSSLEGILNNFLKYTTLSVEEFNKRYTLPSLPDVKPIPFDKNKAIKKAFNNRPDLKILSTEKKALKLENKLTELFKYPQISLSIYNTYDIKYEEGFKIGLEVEYPFERRKYIGKYIKIRKKVLLPSKKEEKIKRDIQISIENIYTEIKTLQSLIKNAKKEIELMKKLEKAEEKRFILGAGNLFMVNKREINTLKSIKKYLKYKLEYVLLKKKLLKEIGTSYTGKGNFDRILE